jgi:hypothetical protein
LICFFVALSRRKWVVPKNVQGKKEKGGNRFLSPKETPKSFLPPVVVLRTTRDIMFSICMRESSGVLNTKENGSWWDC